MTNNRLLGALLAAGLFFVACGGGGGGGTSPGATTGGTSPRATTGAGATTGATTGATSPRATTGAAATTGTGGDAATVQLAENDEFGQILVDAEGMVLYGFVPDEAEGEPTCYDQCATAWPPLLVEGEDYTVGEGLDEADFSTAERTDEGTQLKIGTYPLYYFANDEEPGDTNGQGVGENWFVVGADGELIREAE
jgi:predicted lipoprotein with Yx(FWY)xxD motif